MASPPAAFSPAGSPPYPSHSQLPSKKRSSNATELSVNPSLKRRKPSAMSATSSASAHPLRQTSFPPDESQGQAFSPTFKRSPSADTMSLVSGSQVSGAPLKKKRGRKSKAEQRAREAADEAARGAASSVAGGPAASIASGPGGAGGASKQGADDDGEGGGDSFEIPENMASKAAIRTKEQVQKEEDLRALLKQRFSDEQFHRYEVWHKQTLTIGALRRYINSITSQSVTPSIPQAMQVVCKLFLGDIVEEARRVQQEWIAAGEKQVPGNEEEKILNEVPKHRRQAPLRPDHLQEAYRRWKRSSEAGGSGGSLMLWHQQTRNGAERFAPRAGGKRFFT
ncbi:histone-fold-containing protein [Pseudomassariella vexata]|uniref:Histone-fold-containing protein n=1 Tax=Pseudomassariella vexata TaxID=1141098 RepID=A0A1Y2EIY7_9PEZI|nr:histone-fold-containing protein [Pseudomassariella vexata]ORY71529.1 histone-fold-containing protein [Pseudomassariella vexata]